MRFLKRLGSAKLFLWGGHFVVTALYFVQVIAIARIAGAETMGVYVAVTTVIGIIVRVMDVGLPSSILYFIRRNPADAGFVAKSTFIHTSLMIPLAVMAAYLLRYFPFESSIISVAVSDSIVVIAAGLILQLASGLLANMALALQMISVFNALRATPAVALCALLAWAEIYGRPPDAVDLLQMSAISYLIPVALISLLFLVKLQFKPHASGLRSTSLYAYGLGTIPGVAAKVVGQRLDRLILSTTINAVALTQYTVAATVRDGLLVPFNAYCLGFMNELIDLRKQGRSMHNATYRIGVMWFTAMTIASALFAAVMPILLPAVFGLSFKSSVPVAQIVLFSSGFQCVTALYWTYFQAEGRPAVTSWLSILSSVLFLALLLVFVPKWGIWGAGFAILGSSALTAGACVLSGRILQKDLARHVAGPVPASKDG